MDDDNSNTTKQHGFYSSFPSSLDPSQHVVQQQQMPPHHSPERFRRPIARATGRRAHVRASQSHGQGMAALPEYAAYGYPVAQQPSSLAVGNSPQNMALPIQAPMSPESVRQQYLQRQADLQAFNYPLHHHHHHHQQQQQSPYDPQLVYGLAQPGLAHVPYNISLPETFQPRSAESLGSMTPQFSVPQYLESSEHTGEYPTPYLNTQRQSAAYQQQSLSNHPIPLSSTTSSYNSIGAVDNMEQQQQNTQATTDVDTAYRQYQQSLVAAFEHTRAGQLVRAKRLVIEISTWLVDNAQAFGLSQDDSTLYKGRLKLWEDLNNCWLALFSKQKRLTSTPHQELPTESLLTIQQIKRMGEKVIQLCDKLEPMGLVDYQIGFWEEEILDIAQECIDILSPDPSQHSRPPRSSRLSRTSGQFVASYQP